MAEVTEIFLPRRVFKEGAVDWMVSTGGRAQFDWERERMFVWFIDKYDPYAKATPERARRVDVWVPSKAKTKQTATPLAWVLTVVAIVMSLGLVYWAQMLQWKHETRAGIYSLWGF